VICSKYGWRYTRLKTKDIQGSSWENNGYKYLELVNEKMNSAEKNQTWKLFEIPKKQRVVGCKWIFKKEENSLDVLTNSLPRSRFKHSLTWSILLKSNCKIWESSKWFMGKCWASPLIWSQSMVNMPSNMCFHWLLQVMIKIMVMKAMNWFESWCWKWIHVAFNHVGRTRKSWDLI